jgi:hypothetical protein
MPGDFQIIFRELGEETRECGVEGCSDGNVRDGEKLSGARLWKMLF